MRRFLLSSAVVGCIATRLVAQTAAPDTASTDSAATPSTLALWLTRGDAWAFGGAGAATLAIAPFDERISGDFKPTHTRDSRTLHAIARDVAFFGGDGPFITSAALIAGTSDGSEPQLHAFAVHNTESIALATVVTGLGKGLFGRALPGVETRHEFELGRSTEDGRASVGLRSSPTALSSRAALAAPLATPWRGCHIPIASQGDSHG